MLDNSSFFTTSSGMEVKVDADSKIVSVTYQTV
jgi:hypothetical protein